MLERSSVMLKYCWFMFLFWVQLEPDIVKRIFLF